MATLALLSAAAHWWPFALLLCPAVAVGATGASTPGSSIVAGARAAVSANAISARAAADLVEWAQGTRRRPPGRLWQPASPRFCGFFHLSESEHNNVPRGLSLIHI